MGTSLGTFGVPISELDDSLKSRIGFDLALAGPVATDFAPMNPAQRCHKFEQGVDVIIRVIGSDGNPVGLRTASALVILLAKPSGDRISVPSSLLGNGYDGQMYFSTTRTIPAGAGLDQAGLWYLQGMVTLSGNTQYTQWGCFIVAPNLGE